MIVLSDVARGRNNNFNLIRILAASAVFVSHSFQVVTGTPDAEPLRSAIGMTPGTLAVDVFFLTSGFLVTASLLRKPNVAAFALARLLRIYPALLLVMFATVFVLGPIVTAVPLSAYFGSLETWKYLLRGSTLVLGIEQHLPGVFQTNPVEDVVNSSLWTMPHEIRMYLILAGLWLATLAFRAIRMAVFKAALVFCAGASLLAVLLTDAEVVDRGAFLHLFSFFFLGSAAYVLRSKIPFSGMAAAAGAGIIAVSLVIGVHVFQITYALPLAYLTFYTAYAPTPLLHNYNKLGDYSYGVYIFAWPVQQVLERAFTGLSAYQLIAFGGPIILALAIASWHLVERRALKLKDSVPLERSSAMEATSIT